MNDLLHTLTTRLDANATQRARLDAYAAGTSPITYLAPEVREALGGRLTRVSVNIPRMLVDALTERLRLVGFDGADVWDTWNRLHGPTIADQVHRESMILGDAYVLVWGDQSGRAVLSPESAHQMTVITDPETGTVTAALKRWTSGNETFAVVYEADRITTLKADVANATSGGFTITRTVDNRLGVVPVVPFVNSGRILEAGVSEMEGVIPLSDANTKLLTDLLTASEATSRARRFASGIELAEDDEGNVISPFGENDKMLISESADARFGQLPGADLTAYDKAVGVIMRQVSAVSGLPESMLGIGGDNPTSADSIRASEAALTAKAEAKQRTLGRSWAQVARLVATVEGSAPSGPVVAQWADPATRSEAQVADATVKLYGSGLLPASYALKRLGYSEDDIAEIRAARRAEALDTAGLDLGVQ